MKVIASAISDVGIVRTRNEDMVAVDDFIFRDSSYEKEYDLTIEKETIFFAVADGMGGHAAGDVASETVLKRLLPVIKHLPAGLDNANLKGILENSVKDIHEYLTQESKLDPAKRGMGSTLIALLIYEGRYYYFSAGDSRLYRFRRGLLKQISKDHSVSELFGKDRSDSHMIINSIGGGEDVFLEFNELTETVLPGDCWILCSDGVTDMLNDEELEVLLEETNPIDRIVESAKQKGGKDNISLILLNFILESNQSQASF